MKRETDGTPKAQADTDKVKQDGAESRAFSMDASKSVYSEAGQWLRMVNMIAWTTAALLVPTAVACVGLALAHPAHRVALTVGSIGVLGLWVWILRPYAWSAQRAREALMYIEADWNAETCAHFTRSNVRVVPVAQCSSFKPQS